MIVIESIKNRDAVSDAVLCVSNGDGSWTVYQTGDAIPEKYQYAVNQDSE